MAVVNGQLYAVGGFDGTAYLKTIEVYDPEVIIVFFLFCDFYSVINQTNANNEINICTFLRQINGDCADA